MTRGRWIALAAAALVCTYVQARSQAAGAQAGRAAPRAKTHAVGVQAEKQASSSYATNHKRKQRTWNDARTVQRLRSVRTTTMDTSPGSDAPPISLGGFLMTPFGPDPRPSWQFYESVDSPCGDASVEFEPSLLHRRASGGGWSEWSHGYAGDTYDTSGQAAQVTLTLPTGTCAFYFYVQPQNYQEHTFEVTTPDGASSGTLTAFGMAEGAVYVGVFGENLTTVTVTCTGGPSPTQFAVGEFGIACECVPAFGACCDLIVDTCTDTVPPQDCVGEFKRWFQDESCGSGLCDITGACCFGWDCVELNAYQCDQQDGEFLGDGTTCDFPSTCMCEEYFVQAPGQWSGTTCGMRNECTEFAEEEDVTYAIDIPISGTWVISPCFSDSFLRMLVGTSCCSADIYDTGALSSGCGEGTAGGHLWVNRPYFDYLPAGTYYVTIEGFNGSCADYELAVYQPSAACCVDLGEGPECIGDMTKQECEAQSGMWYEGESCDAFLCFPECSEHVLVVEFGTDFRPLETRWEVVNTVTGEVICNGGDDGEYTESGKIYTTQCCLPAIECFEFVAIDAEDLFAGDGQRIPGGYRLTFNGEVVADTLRDGWIGPYHGQYAFEEVGDCIFPGACCFGDLETPCEYLTEAECDARGGSWLGRLVECGEPRDCDGDGWSDFCELGLGEVRDCNQNGRPDDCDIAEGRSIDCQGNGIPDECEVDCNQNGIADECDIANCAGEFWCQDCQGDGIPDGCQIGRKPPIGSERDGLPSILYLTGHDWDVPEYSPEFRAGLEAEGFIVDHFDALDATPTLAYLAQYSAIMTWAYSGYQDPGAIGDLLADYVDLGGTVVLGQWTVAGPWGPSLGGRIMADPGYVPAVGSTRSHEYAWYAGDGQTKIHDGVGAYASFGWSAVTPATFNGETAMVDGTTLSDFDEDIGIPIVLYWKGFSAPGGNGGVVFYCNGNTALNNGHGDWVGLTANLCRIQGTGGFDCNENEIPDECEIDIADGGLCDPDTSGHPCFADCDQDGVPDVFDDFEGDGCEFDCNETGIADDCELEGNDCNGNGIPDECDPDCNENGVPDECDISVEYGGLCEGDLVPDGPCSRDCNGNGIPDECESSDDCDGDGTPDLCDPDENENGISDVCEILFCDTLYDAAGWCQDCQGDGIPDGAQLGLDEPWGSGDSCYDRARDDTVSVLYAPADVNDPALRTAIEAEGCTTGYFNANQGTPTLDELLPYTAVVTFVNYNYADQVGFGNVLADYVDAGGTVILGQWTLPTFAPSSSLAGRIMDEPGYNPATGFEFDWNGGAYNGDGLTEIHAGVSAYGSLFWDIATPVTFDGTPALTDGTVSPGGHPAVVYWDGYAAPAGGGGIVFYSPGLIGLTYGNGEWGRLIANMAKTRAFTGSDCNLNCVPDECEPDCDGDGIPNDCEQCGDLDQDEDVDADDYHLFIEAFGGPVDGVPTHDACTDYDDDGMVTALDYQHWLLCFREYIDGSTAVRASGAP